MKPQYQDWSKFLNHRTLCRPADLDRPPKSYEITPLEQSPSGAMVKFRNKSGNDFWTDANEYRVVEDLGVVKGTP